jgi:hypothetical protein
MAESEAPSRSAPDALRPGTSSLRLVAEGPGPEDLKVLIALVKRVLAYALMSLFALSVAACDDGSDQTGGQEPRQTKIGEPNAGEILTVENSGIFKALLATPQHAGPEAAQFAAKYAGRTIRFDGIVAHTSLVQTHWISASSLAESPGRTRQKGPSSSSMASISLT